MVTDERSRVAAGAGELASWAKKQARNHDAARQLSLETAARITTAGFAAHFVPVEWGGAAGTFSELVNAVAAIAEGCTSTGWCATLFAAHGRLAAYLPLLGRKSLWAQSPDVRIAAAIIPAAGEAAPVDDGWELSGRWTLASGVDHADWVLLAAPTAGEHRIFAVPRENCTVLDSWHHVGLRGTGSNTVQVQGVYVPAAATMTLEHLARPHSDPESARCHLVPYPMVAALIFAAPLLGAARGALAEWTAVTAAKYRLDGVGQPSADVEVVLTRSSAEIEAAALLLRSASERADQGEVTTLTVGQNARDAAVAADLCLTATERLFRSAGARSQGDDHDLQRYWRDVHAGAMHGALGMTAASARYAAAAFGGQA